MSAQQQLALQQQVIAAATAAAQQQQRQAPGIQGPGARPGTRGARQALASQAIDTNEALAAAQAFVASQGGPARRRAPAQAVNEQGFGPAPANAGRKRNSRTANFTNAAGIDPAFLKQVAAVQGARSRAGIAPTFQARAAGKHGQKATGRRTGRNVSGLTPEEAVTHFVTTIQGRCPGVSEESVNQFLRAVNESGYNMTNLDSIMRLLHQQGLLNGPVDPTRKSRWAGGDFSDQVVGTSGARGPKVSHSYLWELLLDNCNNIPILTAAITGTAAGTFGNIGPDGPAPTPLDNYINDDATRLRINREVAAFVAAYPQCQIHEADVTWLLDALDILHINGKDLKAVANEVGLVGWGPLESFYDARTAGMAFSPLTYGTTEETFGQVKASLVWKAAQQFCNNLPAFNKLIDRTYFTNGLTQSLGATGAGLVPQPYLQKVNPGLYQNFGQPARGGQNFANA